MYIAYFTIKLVALSHLRHDVVDAQVEAQVDAQVGVSLAPFFRIVITKSHPGAKKTH